MEDKEIENMLSAYHIKPDETWVMKVMQLNMDCIEKIQTQKARAKLKPLVIIKIVAVILGITWILFLSILVYYSLTLSKIFFVVSAGFNIIITTIAIIVYIKHIVLIGQINSSESITGTQEKLAKLQLSTLNVARILFLTLPFYTTWYINKDMFANGSTGIWIFQICMTLLFTYFAIWLYRNISYKNANKKWFRILFNSSEWTSVTKAMEFLKEINDFKKES